MEKFVVIDLGDHLFKVNVIIERLYDNMCAFSMPGENARHTILLSRSFIIFFVTFFLSIKIYFYSINEQFVF